MISIDSLLHFLKCQFQLYEIPFRVYRGGKLLAKFEEFSLNEFEPGMEVTVLQEYVFKEDEPNIKFNLHFSLIMDGAVYNRENDLLVFVGNVRSAKVTEPLLRRYLSYSNVKDLSDESIKRLHVYVNSIPLVAPALFLSVLSGINAVLNDEILDTNNLLDQGAIELDTQNTKGDLLKKREDKYFGGENNINSFEVESRFLFFIRNGMVKQLKDYCHSLKGFNIVVNSANAEIWRIAKDRTIVAIALASRVAAFSGVSSVEANQLADLYIQKVELCYSDKTLNELRFNMLVDFAERVASLNIQPIENYTVKRIAEYILDNIEDRLCLEDIAEKFKINKNYLCRVFKEETGMGLTDFINSHKINAAKEMLRYTNKSLVEISYYFSFCSQSYFQQIFKKFTGKTPIEFRNSTEEI